MNVLYLHRKSDWGKEIIYSLRSVEKYIQPDKVVIAGDLPDVQNVDYIPVKRESSRFEDVNSILLTAIDKLKGEDWVLMHDDFFILEPYKPILRYDGLLKDRARRTGGERRECLQSVLDIIPNAKNYALHYPLPFKLSVMRDAVGRFKVPFSYMNAYGNTDKDFVQLSEKDCKFKAPLITKQYLNGLPSFSTYAEDDSFGSLLETLYPTKSQYEL